MKKSDIATIVTIALISMVAAYVLTTTFVGSASPKAVKVKTVEPISADVVQPDATVFNKDAINPTVEVIIGGNSQ